jgi:bifunctional ADP-heptose synthase (sugar kinase/adenylyltransferase)
MKKVLVIGDTITDEYIFGTATRLCPEGPVPVIIPQRLETRGGGARLVANQLEILIGEENVMFLSGSQSKKKRIFADDHLICRLDEDSLNVSTKFEEFVLEHLLGEFDVFYDLLIISDYGKGALSRESANRIIKAAKIPVLVDAKNNFSWYGGTFAIFPNERESSETDGTPHIIRKLAARGCMVDGKHVPLDKDHQVRDVTGAGDVFLAAFAAMMIDDISHGCPLNEIDLVACARYANLVAARSVEFVGTKIVADIPLH